MPICLDERYVEPLKVRREYSGRCRPAGSLRLVSINNKNLLIKIIYIKIEVIKKICHYILMNQAGWGASTLTHCLEIGIGTRRRNGPLILV